MKTKNPDAVELHSSQLPTVTFKHKGTAFGLQTPGTPQRLYRNLVSFIVSSLFESYGGTKGTGQRPSTGTKEYNVKLESK